ncbi:J domain-containing protein [Favolaschia claudopus]|uniref:J domain-containing protein n=1 Tax=Favolaschia claudopus TaxID=2862362 RepID=A0AAV9ZTI4_9AGAR
MGGTLSRFRLALRSFREIVAVYDELNKRIEQSPGIPVLNPSVPYWAIPPSPLAQHGSSDALPAYADIVIIGSGIAGTAFARTVLGFKQESEKVPQVVMLEARDTCSGATGRNGGHITPVLYHDYPVVRKRLGPEMAKRVIEFRLAHLSALIHVCEEEDILEDSQCREVETFDVFFDQETFDAALENLDLYLHDLPEQRKMWRILLQLSPRAVGAISTTAGAVHPYRLVTGVLSRLLERHPKNFHLFTRTPCLSVTSEGDHSFYTVSTSRGTVRARHVIHATNAWVSHLLPQMRKRVVPARGHMSAQRPGVGLGQAILQRPVKTTTQANPNDSVLTLTEPAIPPKSSWLGTRSWVMHGDGIYDYLTQQPPPSPAYYDPPAAEFMFGGGLARGELSGGGVLKDIGVADDSSWDMATAAYLGGALSQYFGGWGAEGRDLQSKRDSSEEIEAGRIKKLWTGILEYYDLLGVAVDADDTELKKAYRRQAMKYHPDKNKSADAEEKYPPNSPFTSKAYQVLSNPNDRATYDKHGKSMVDKEGTMNMEDAAGFFANVFGGERFVDYIGEISIMKDMTATASTMMTDEERAEMEKAMNEGASTPIGAANRTPLSSGPATPANGPTTPPTSPPSNQNVSTPTSTPASITMHSEADSPSPPNAKDRKRNKMTQEQKEKLREQDKERQKVMEARVAMLTTKMIERLRPFVEAKNPGDKDDPETQAFEKKMKREADDLKLESFGVELLHAIGNVYMMKASSFMKSKKMLGIPGFFSRLKEKTDLVKDVFGVIGSALSVRDLMLEMERQQAKGELGEEELRALEMDVTGKIMLASWRGARLEVVQVLRGVRDSMWSTIMVAEAALPKSKQTSTRAAKARREQMIRQDQEKLEKEKAENEKAAPPAH